MNENKDEVLPADNSDGVNKVKFEDYAFLMESSSIEQDTTFYTTFYILYIIHIYRVNNFDQCTQVSCKESKMEKNDLYKSCRIQRKTHDENMNLTLSDIFKARSMDIFLNEKFPILYYIFLQSQL